MRIKKHTNKNEYLLTPDGMWVRNFTKPLVPYLDLNQTIQEDDHILFLKNEYNNCRARYTWIDAEQFVHEKAVIISDGYGFKNKHRLIESLPSDVAVIGVHGSLSKWEASKSLNYYVVNNPYKECMTYLPRHWKAVPKCIASTRTNYEFLNNYRGMKYRYVPVNEKKYSGVETKDVEYQIDDYRNPICAAIGLAYHFRVKQLLLLCCDSVFPEERPGAEKLGNGMYTYPTQKVAHGLIDGCLYWLSRRPYNHPQIGHHSAGPLYDNAVYIEEDKLLSFLQLGALDEKKE